LPLSKNVKSVPKSKDILVSENLANQVRNLVNQAISELHPEKKFIPGESAVPVTGKVFGAPEIEAAVNASLDYWH
jgi:CDP-6-deoxy-D-xylo-4-hexulose-3-dehydrase